MEFPKATTVREGDFFNWNLRFVNPSSFMDDETDTQNVVIHANEMLIDRIFLQDYVSTKYI